jgi:hypothetical protein
MLDKFSLTYGTLWGPETFRARAAKRLTCSFGLGWPWPVRRGQSRAMIVPPFLAAKASSLIDGRQVDPSCQHHCPQSIAVMLRSCKAASLVQVQVRAPIRSLSSFGRAPIWYVGGGRIEACREHHAPVAQLAGGISLRTRAVRVRISPGAPFLARVAQSQEARP